MRAYLVDEDTELAQSGTGVARVRDVGHGRALRVSLGLDAKGLVAGNIYVTAIVLSVLSGTSAYLF